MNQCDAAVPAPTIEADVVRLRRWQSAGRHAEVLSDAQELVASFPENRDLLLIIAVSLRHLGRIPQALATLDRAEAVQSKSSQTHQERGLCHVALRDAPRAIEALLRAVHINPALPMSWRMLEGLYRISGDPTSAANAAAHVATLRELPPAVVTATSLYSDGDLGPAEDMIRSYLLRHGDHPEAMRLLAKIGMARDVLDDAELLLDAVLALVPDHRAARYEYAHCLVKRQKYLPAQDQIRRLLELEPDNLDYRSLAATTAVGLGRHSEAIALYREMLAAVPGSPDVQLWLGHALKTVGDVPDAIEAYRAAAAARPDFGDAYWSLANLKTFRFSSDEIAQMRAAEADPATSTEDRYHLSFALGKALEDNGEIQESWACYARGNALKSSQSRYSPEAIESNTLNQMQVCTSGFFRRRSGWGDARRDPIFIVGLPRSGSTLLEQILASHSQVEGTQELPDVQRFALELQGRDQPPGVSRYPAVLADMTNEDFLRMAAEYLSATQEYRTGRPYFIDKMPNNFRHIGLIHLMFPNASIIDARRDPMPCCFSNLKQLFANGQEFTYGIENIARYYRTYLELMRHWDAALPGRVLRVHHEDVVLDLEGAVRRTLDYCGLEFEPSCIQFHQTKRSVRTPSSEQVRQPIFREGLDQWRKYERWLTPLQEALGDACVRYRD